MVKGLTSLEEQMLATLRAVVKSPFTCACPAAYGLLDQEKAPHKTECPVPLVYAAIKKAEKFEA